MKMKINFAVISALVIGIDFDTNFKFGWCYNTVTGAWNYIWRTSHWACSGTWIL